MDEYLIDEKAVRAYLAATVQEGERGSTTYASAARQASRWLREPHIQAAIRAGQRDARQRSQATANKVLREIGWIAFADLVDLWDDGNQCYRTNPRHMPMETRRAIQSIKVRRETVRVRYNGRTRTETREQIIEFKLWSKTDALQKLCNHLGLKTALPPLEVLLSLLPPPVAEQLKAMLAEPSMNGNGVHR